MTEISTAGGGIYAIRNKKSGKCYVGSAVSFKTRWKRHRTELRAGSHHSQKLQRAWDKHGESGFEFSVLEHIHNPEQLVEREQHWMLALNAVRGGYNVCPSAGSVLGIKHGEAMKAKMREIRAKAPISPEQQEKMADARKLSSAWQEAMKKVWEQNKGRKQSDEAKAKIAEASRKMMADPERREAIRQNNIGRRHTEETKAALRQVVRRKGWSHTPEALEKIAEAGRGRVISLETIEKRRQTRKLNKEMKCG